MFRAADATPTTGGSSSGSGVVLVDYEELANAESLMDFLCMPRLGGSITRSALAGHVAADDRQRWLEKLDESSRGGVPAVVHHRLRDATGVTREVVTTFVPFVAQGRVRGAYVVTADLTRGGRSAIDEDGRPGEAVTDSPAAFGLRLLGLDPDLLDPHFVSQMAALTIADITLPDAPLVWVSPAFTALTGYPSVELLGHNCRLLQGPATEPAAVDSIRTAIADRRVLHVTLTNYRRDGTAFRNQLSLAPIRNALGVVTHYIGYQHETPSRHGNNG